MGASAKNQLVTNTKNTIWGWKKLIGRKFSERVVQNEIPHFTYEVIESKDGGIGIQVCFSTAVNCHEVFITVVRKGNGSLSQRVVIAKKVAKCSPGVRVRYVFLYDSFAMVDLCDGEPLRWCTGI